MTVFACKNLCHIVRSEVGNAKAQAASFPILLKIQADPISEFHWLTKASATKNMVRFVRCEVTTQGDGSETLRVARDGPRAVSLGTLVFRRLIRDAEFEALRSAAVMEVEPLTKMLITSYCFERFRDASHFEAVRGAVKFTKELSLMEEVKPGRVAKRPKPNKENVGLFGICFDDVPIDTKPVVEPTKKIVWDESSDDNDELVLARREGDEPSEDPSEHSDHQEDNCGIV